VKTLIAVRLVLVGMLCAGLQVASGQAMPGGRGMEPGGQQQMERPRPALERALALPGMQGRWWTNPRVVEQLKVTEEEQKALDAILIEHREKLIDLRAGLQKVELKMEELAMADKLDEAAITAQIDRVAQSRAELEKANAHYLLAIWGKLTAEQRTLVKQYRSGQMARDGWGRGPMRQRMAQPGGMQPGGMVPAAPTVPESK
jgi:Spy/CpxP family protein refolding chaperone